MKKLACLFTVLLSVGCAKAIFRPYVGEQQSWPTAEGSIVNTKYDMPVFTSLPPTPYEVLGELRVESPFYELPEEGHLPKLIEKAREMGADALVFVQGRIYFSTNYGPRHGADAAAEGGKAPTLSQVNSFNPESFERGVTILAVRWIGGPPAGLPPVATPAEAMPVPSAEDATQPAANQPAPAAPAGVAETPATEALPGEAGAAQ